MLLYMSFWISLNITRFTSSFFFRDFSQTSFQHLPPHPFAVYLNSTPNLIQRHLFKTFIYLLFIVPFHRLSIALSPWTALCPANPYLPNLRNTTRPLNNYTSFSGYSQLSWPALMNDASPWIPGNTWHLISYSKSVIED